MTTLSDAAVARLRALGDWPELPEARYRVEELLGRGGMGAVYRVHDLALGRDVAVKVLASDAADAGAAARLRREARVLARLEHPGIVPVYDVGQLPDGRSYYVMQLVRGARLDAHARALPSLREVLRVLERVCEAVAYAHGAGVIHRDLKPSNVMMGPYGEVQVLDFGVARVEAEPAAEGHARPASAAPVDERLTRDGDVIGTPGFMAPEQAAGQTAHADARADVFALGAMLRALLAERGEVPPAPLAAIIVRATAASPAARYQDVPALRDDLRHFLDHEPVAAFRESPGARVARLYARHRVAILLVLTYLVVRAVILLTRGV